MCLLMTHKLFHTLNLREEAPQLTSMSLELKKLLTLDNSWAKL